MRKLFFVLTLSLCWLTIFGLVGCGKNDKGDGFTQVASVTYKHTNGNNITKNSKYYVRLNKDHVECTESEYDAAYKYKYETSNNNFPYHHYGTILKDSLIPNVGETVYFRYYADKIFWTVTVKNIEYEYVYIKIIDSNTIMVRDKDGTITNSGSYTIVY